MQPRRKINARLFFCFFRFLFFFLSSSSLHFFTLTANGRTLIKRLRSFAGAGRFIKLHRNLCIILLALSFFPSPLLSFCFSLNTVSYRYGFVGGVFFSLPSPHFFFSVARSQCVSSSLSPLQSLAPEVEGRRPQRAVLISQNAGDTFSAASRPLARPALYAFDRPSSLITTRTHETGRTTPLLPLNNFRVPNR